MITLVDSINLVQKIIGKQEFRTNTIYRLCNHCMQVMCSDGLLLYHLMTKELVLLSFSELSLINQLPCSITPEMQELVSHWFLRPLNSSDCEWVNQVKSIAQHLQPAENDLTTFTIFTTTDCNARCFYCFELGSRTISMTEQTAHDVGHFIINHCNNKQVNIRWFGGEPLLNYTAIDIVTKMLKENGIDYLSTMVSNGYLFNYHIISCAKNDWHLRHVQITLDGTENIYNQRKAYQHIIGSAYKRVISNIQQLLDADIEVTVRLNMDENNEKDLYALCDELAHLFLGRRGFCIYLAILYENVGPKPIYRTPEQRNTLYRKAAALRQYINKLNLASKPDLKRSLALNRCMADGNGATTITPDGYLGRCEHYFDKELWGSIYSDSIDTDVIMQWKSKMPVEEACEACVIYPECVRLKKCPGLLDHCTSNDRAIRIEKIQRSIIHTFDAWKHNLINNNN